MEEMVRQTDQIINFTREINRRMTESGVAGVEGLVGLYDQLRTALAKVSPQEIEWAQSEVNRVLDSLKKLSSGPPCDAVVSVISLVPVERRAFAPARLRGLSVSPPPRRRR